jgi:hypothetical protein
MTDYPSFELTNSPNQRILHPMFSRHITVTVIARESTLAICAVFSRWA